MKTSYVIRIGAVVGLFCFAISNAVAINLLKDIFDSKRIDYARIERKWGYLHHAILRLNLDEKNWEGGDSTTIYGQNDLRDWTFEEKRFLVFLLFLNFQFTERESVAIANMLGKDRKVIASELATLDGRDIAIAVGRVSRSRYTKAIVENFQRNVQLLVSKTESKGGKVD